MSWKPVSLFVRNGPTGFEPVCLEVGGAVVPCTRIEVDWSTHLEKNELIVHIPMSTVNVQFEESGDAVQTQSKQQEASTKANK